MGLKLNPITGQLDLAGSAAAPGGGITSLNALTEVTQTFAAGTSGTSFNIVSALGVHNFNIPNASAVGVTRGLVSKAEYDSFLSDKYKVDKFTLDGTDITNEYVTLSGTPTTAGDTRLLVIGGVEQEYGVDFTVSGNQVTWNGLGLDGVLEVGDDLIIVFN